MLTRLYDTNDDTNANSPNTDNADAGTGNRQRSVNGYTHSPYAIYNSTDNTAVDTNANASSTSTATSTDSQLTPTAPFVHRPYEFYPYQVPKSASIKQIRSCIRTRTMLYDIESALLQAIKKLDDQAENPSTTNSELTAQQLERQRLTDELLLNKRSIAIQDEQLNKLRAVLEPKRSAAVATSSEVLGIMSSAEIIRSSIQPNSCDPASDVQSHTFRCSKKYR